MKMTSRFISLALRSYPGWWRERYHDEVLVVIECLIGDGRSPLRVAFNLVVASVRTRMSGAGAPASRGFWIHRTQRSLLVASLPWFAIVPLSAAFASTIGEYGYTHGPSSVRLGEAGMVARSLQRYMFYVFVIAVVVALVGWRSGLDGQPLRLRWFWLVNRTAMVSILLVISALFLGQHDATSSLAELFARVGLGFLVISWLSMPGVVTQMLRSGELPVRSLHSEVRLSMWMAGLNAALTLLAVGIQVAISLQPLPVPGASYILYRSTLGGWDVALLIGYFILTAISATGAHVARRSYASTLNV